MGRFQLKLNNRKIKPTSVIIPKQLSCRGVGLTATRQELTGEQKDLAKKLIPQLLLGGAGHNMLHHGDCINGDEFGHKVARKYNAHIVIHPPINKAARAFCEGNYTMPKKEYLERNKCIVDSSIVLIAIPNSEQEELRSGTWSTVRYARKQGKIIYIILPNGILKCELNTVKPVDSKLKQGYSRDYVRKFDWFTALKE